MEGWVLSMKDICSRGLSKRGRGLLSCGRPNFSLQKT